MPALDLMDAGGEASALLSQRPGHGGLESAVSPGSNPRSVELVGQFNNLVSPSHQGSCGSCWAVAANVHSLLKMVLIFSAMAGASVCFPHCCSECGCGRRRGPLPAEAQCTKHQDGLSRARHRDPAEPQRMTAPAAESKDAQTSVACCRGKF